MCRVSRSRRWVLFLSIATVAIVATTIAIVAENCPLCARKIVAHWRFVGRFFVSQVYFGAGCFWGPALRFKRVPGVLDTEVGYCNGQVPSVTYEDVCRGDTGHNGGY